MASPPFLTQYFSFLLFEKNVAYHFYDEFSLFLYGCACSYMFRAESMIIMLIMTAFKSYSVINTMNIINIEKLNFA